MTINMKRLSNITVRLSTFCYKSQGRWTLRLH